MIFRNSRMKIGYLLKMYPKISETFILNEIKALERDGVLIQIFSLLQPSDAIFHTMIREVRSKVIYVPSSLFKDTITVFKAHFGLFLEKPKRYWCAFLFLITRKESNRFIEFYQAGFLAWSIKKLDIVHLHAHYASYPTGVAELVHLMIGIPYSFTAHAKDIYLPKLNPGDLLQTKIRKAQFVVTCTDANRKHLNGLCPDVKSIYTIYHGLDTSTFVPSKKQNDQKRVPIILSVGRFVEKKGFAYLVKACKLLKDKGYSFQCRIIGEADRQTDLIKGLIKSLKLTNTVVLKSATTQEKLMDIYNMGTIFVLPCQIVENGDRDGIPNVLVEAMAMEIPVVSTDISGISELIENGVNGLLVPQKDAISLANAIELLLKDNVLRSRLGTAARNKIRKMFVSKDTTTVLKTLFTKQLKINGKISL